MNSELIKLRVSVARIAQIVGLEDDIPGAPIGRRWLDDPANEDGLPYETLHFYANHHEHGWNELCERIVEEIADLIARQSEPTTIVETV